MKHLKILIVIALSLATYNISEAQTKTKTSKLSKKLKRLDLYEEEVLDFEQYKNNVGKILFSNHDFERELPESKYITSYKMGDKLSMRAYMKNSSANSMMIQLAESGKEKIKDINEKKYDCKHFSYTIWKIYLDGKPVGETNRESKKFNSEDFATFPTSIADLKDDNGFYFGETLYEDLLAKEELLTPGTHKLKLELIPKSNIIHFDFAPIATGEIDLIIDGDDHSYITMDNCIPKNIRAKASDPKLEEEFKQIFLKHEPKGHKFVKLWLPDNRWHVQRAEEYPNPITNKSRAAVIVTKNDKGELFYDLYGFRKDFDGVEYGNITLGGYINSSTGRTVSPSRKISKHCEKLL
ncbi:hypothetical protein [Flavivirga jejuensis]|uniref:Uncharacterized protein n=1 Tax=Flavivirga jejuensis TaxID=870487 RepID=A0ABT8WUN9_9FLAO|nr:hypothetical protein [Flavivirga jejuensis]MDO5976890.1 hypothetical protein [Flavivirga jejuensis]